MQNIDDILFYNDNFIERIKNEVFPIFELWSIHPLDNKDNWLISGNTEEFEKFTNFLNKHADLEYPYDLIMIVGTGEKNYPTVMSNKTKKGLKIRFDHIHPEGIGTPLVLPKYP